MDNYELLERLGNVEPPEVSVTAHVGDVIEGAARGESMDASLPPTPRRAHGPRARRAILLAATALMALALVGGVLVATTGRGGLKAPLTTPWRAGHSLGATGAHARSGTWALLDDVLSGTWVQDAAGPPPGYLDCPTAATCYVMSGRWASPDAGAPLLGESLYASGDLGATWTELAMPSGFSPTTPLACADALDCAAGGTYQGQPVLVSTSDGGHRFTVVPLPSGDGTLYSLSCPTDSYCAGLAATSSLESNWPLGATFLATHDDGATFSDQPIIAGDDMLALACSSSDQCTAVGTDGDPSTSGQVAATAAVTTDGGSSWRADALPAGFTTTPGSSLSCSSALDCQLLGFISIPTDDQAECAQVQASAPSSITSTTTTTTPPSSTVSPEVAAVARFEASIAAAEQASLEKEKQAVGFVCSSSNTMLVSDVASTTDGGLTWTPELLPADVPDPQLDAITCPTAQECWVAGSDAVPQAVPGGGEDGGSSLLLGTTDGGVTWSKVSFSIPANAPNFDGQSFLSIGSISCATDDVCAAVGTAAQSSPSAPFYSLSVPSSGG